MMTRTIFIIAIAVCHHALTTILSSRQVNLDVEVRGFEMGPTAGCATVYLNTFFRPARAAEK